MKDTIVYGRDVDGFAKDLREELKDGWRFFATNITSRAQAPTRRKKAFQFTMVFSKDIFRNPEGLPKHAILIGLILLPTNETSDKAIALSRAEPVKEIIRKEFKR